MNVTTTATIPATGGNFIYTSWTYDQPPPPDASGALVPAPQPDPDGSAPMALA